MCFQEFIGYTCGHCSMPVLRPCSLTTSVHQNPVCSLQATRPFISPEMCPACSRIMHTRAVLIQEWEHHFLHERGACGCDVIFPDLVRPRIIGGEAVFRYQAMMEQQEQQSKAAMDNAHSTHSNKNNSQAVMSYALPPTPPPQDGQRAPPIFQEVHGPDGQLAIAVRLPSLYAAEWVEDHRKLHQRGECSCRADFTPYKPEWVAQDGGVPDQQQQRVQPQIEYATPIAPASLSPERRRAVSVDISRTLLATCNNGDNKANDGAIEVRTEVNHPKHRRSSSAEATTTSNSSTRESSDIGVEITTSDFAHYMGEEDKHQKQDMITIDPPSMVPTHNWGPALRAISADGGVFKPQSSAAVNQIHHHEEHDIEMHMANMHMGAGMQPQPQQQGVCSFTNLTGGNPEEHQRFRNPTALPIASLPVGAGPEGRHRHMVPFEQCVLRRYPPGVRTRYYN
ncbi:hypothetical protein PpBr36_07624 [Pyricularia pennisetigena]|uniref:hypothetical protein n=1 Tax=Pyricularia pennisetigena TaxID=1578925 RepID=UPI00114F8C31|nr:hypothetical protein PpBr36_07624 [Pyricularia pennisetigena]TLS25020.1 hypothetical protein PpBr36_07624 [Pyricularia pennisetigena]